jgi:hypothetical protein
MESYRFIPLTGKRGAGRFVKVSEQDYPLLSTFKWFLTPAGTGYAGRTQRLSGRNQMVLMHRMILGLKAGDGKHCDHINGDTLDNCRGNLREVSHSQNMQNRSLNRNNRSGVKGVSWDTQKRKWRATIQVEGKTRYLGRFDDLDEAGRAYQQAARRLFGDFSRS